MENLWPVSPWVMARRDRLSFALQIFPNDTPADPARHFLAAGQLAERLGFDAVFASDHPAWGLEPFLHLTALAMTTERIGLGTNVICANYRHPVMMARLAADLDNLSGGRLILGLGSGWDASEFANFGLSFPPARQRQALLAEAITIIRGVWGQVPFTFVGQHFQTAGAQVRPAPVQRPSPPLLIAGGGEQVTLRQVAEHADACNFLAADVAGGVRTPEDVQRKLAALRVHCQALGRPYESVLRTHLTGWLILAEDEARLRAKLRHYVPDGIEARFSGSWRGFVVAGTPEQVIPTYQALAEAGIQYFIIETLDAADEETIRLLAEAVVPQVQPPRPDPSRQQAIASGRRRRLAPGDDS